jgi:hypothetical protein
VAAFGRRIQEHSRASFCRSDKGLLQLYEGFGLFTYMKSTLLAVIFGITGGVAILLAVPAQGNTLVVKLHPEWKWEYGAPVVPQIEEEVPVPEPLDHYSVALAKTKTEKQAPRRYRHVARPRPNFFERLLVSFIKLQKHQPEKSSPKRSRATPPGRG